MKIDNMKIDNMKDEIARMNDQLLELYIAAFHKERKRNIQLTQTISRLLKKMHRRIKTTWKNK